MRRRLAVLAMFAIPTSIPAGAQLPDKAPSTVVEIGEIARQILYVPFYAGIERRYFAHQGITVDLQTTWGPERTATALHTGEVQVVLQGPESVIYTEGDPAFRKVKIFAGLVRTDGMFLVSREKLSMQHFRWEILKGKTVLARRATTTPGLFLEFALRNRGIDPSRDIEYRANIPVPARPRIWRSGMGDFAVFFEPEVSRLERDGKGYPVASIGREVGPVDYTVFMATEAYIRKNPAVIQGWTNAIHKALTWIANATPTEAAEAVATYFPRVGVGLLVRSIERYKTFGMWKTDPTISRKSIADLQSMMIESRVIDPDKRVSYEEVVEPRFAERAREEADKER